MQPDPSAASSSGREVSGEGPMISRPDSPAAYPHPRKLEDAALRLAWAANDVSEHVMDNGLAFRRQLLHDEILNVRALVAEAREQRRAAMRDELADRAVDRETISGG